MPDVDFSDFSPLYDPDDWRALPEPWYVAQGFIEHMEVIDGHLFIITDESCGFVNIPPPSDDQSGDK